MSSGGGGEGRVLRNVCNEVRTQTLNESLACQKLDVGSSFPVLRSLTVKHSISMFLGSTWNPLSKMAQEKVRSAEQSDSHVAWR